MKKVVQPQTRKVYGQTTGGQELQLSTARKINSLLSSGSVSVTSSQPRILKQKLVGQSTVHIQHHSQQQQQPTHVAQIRQTIQQKICYVCGDPAGSSPSLITDTITSTTNTRFPQKIGKLLGDQFAVYISLDDVVCRKCLGQINQMDRLEADFERIRNNLTETIFRKYGIDESDDAAPPSKMQKMSVTSTPIRKQQISSNGGDGDEGMIVVQRKNLRDGENQVTTLYDAPDVKPTIKTLTQSSPTQGKKQNKVYKCVNCEYKTPDMNIFRQHYDSCKPATSPSSQPVTGYKCKSCKRILTSITAMKQHVAEMHSNNYHNKSHQQQELHTCGICGIDYATDLALKKHMEVAHPDVKAIENTSQSTTIISGSGISVSQVYSCKQCTYQINDKASFEDHLRRHIKVKPFKCRICSDRFETRDHAAVHAKTHQTEYFRCGVCQATFQDRELLRKHFEAQHKSGTSTGSIGTSVVTVTQSQASQQLQQLQTVSSQQQPALNTQKLLQETIDEALRDNVSDSIDGSKGIHFFSCNLCSLTFIQENYYIQHMETHKKGRVSQANTTTVTVSGNSGTVVQSLIRDDVRSTNATILSTQPGTATVTTTAVAGVGTKSGLTASTTTTPTSSTTISDADLESIFEKMHSDKAEIDTAAGVTSAGASQSSVGGGNSNSGDNNMVITRDGSGLTFNITIQDETKVKSADNNKSATDANDANTSGDALSAGIDMPVLDPQEESEQQQQQQQQQHEQHDQEQQGGPVSMPSLDDEGDSQSQPSNATGEHVTMDLDDMQGSVDSSQIKFILNENGQIIQLENHIVTDADGNQILLQDHDQIQQLLQSVGVLQTGDGMEGEGMHMDNNQMIIVHGENGETQLIDASMLNADGQIVIQAGEGGEEQMTQEDGTPVSITYSTQEQQQEHSEMHGDEEEEAHQLHEQQLQQQQDEQVAMEQGEVIEEEQSIEEQISANIITKDVPKENGKAKPVVTTTIIEPKTKMDAGGDKTVVTTTASTTVVTTQSQQMVTSNDAMLVLDEILQNEQPSK